MVKNVINGCKVFSAQTYGLGATAPLLLFGNEGERPFKAMRIDFAGPITYKISRRSNANRDLKI